MNPVYDIESFTTLAGELVDRIPPRLCRDLNGGFIVLPEARPEDDLFIMGEYVEDPVLGRFIVFYYGSFAAVLADEPAEVWQDELYETVLHELRHHLELMAGIDDLTREEMEELARWRESLKKEE